MPCCPTNMILFLCLHHLARPPFQPHQENIGSPGPSLAIPALRTESSHASGPRTQGKEHRVAQLVEQAGSYRQRKAWVDQSKIERST